MPDPTPESIIYAPALNAAQAIPASTFPARVPQAPAKIITGAGSMNLSLSHTSEIQKSALYGSGTLISFAVFPAGIIMS